MPKAKHTSASRQKTASKQKAESKPSPAADAKSPVKETFPIVGVGASAGGLEAVTAFLKSLPKNPGMAFVYIQHLDPHHSSALPELLSRATNLKVVQVRDRLAIRPNALYIIPENVSMRIVDNSLRLLPRRNIRGIHMPIDIFFQSLAEERKSAAIGIVLSGTASDGTIGLQEIKAAGGITMAQSEKTARYFDMCRNAIAAGVVDYVLSPEEMATELNRIRQHPYVEEGHSKQELPHDEDSLKQIFTMLRKSFGVDFLHYKPATIQRRISRRMVLSRANTLEEYRKVLKDAPKELDALFEDFLINVTGFFRDPETFEVLKSDIFPRLLRRHADVPIRIWVPGCSTGEEVYSLAITLLEVFGDKARSVQIQIFGTDISESAIERARAGLFTHSIAADVSPDRLKRFFVKTDDGYQINKSIRDLCIFARHNVVKDAPFARLDLISCRNLLIYFGPFLQRKLIPIFHYALNSSGYLVLGGSESIGSFAELFYPSDRRYKIYSKKVAASRVHMELFDHLASERALVSDKGRPAALEGLTERDILKEGDRILLSKFAPAAVVVNDEFEILQFRGQIGPLLEPSSGQASLNLLKMTNESILTHLRTALIKATKEKGPVNISALHVRTEEAERKYDLEIVPFRPPRSHDYYYLVLFTPTGSAVPSQQLRKQTAKERRETEKNESTRLKQEIAATKDYLQSIIEEQEATNEELRAANEEILSSNEELQSTNEELETAKEELQSANEELTTLNEELQNRNSELNQVNSDLNNLLSFVQIPIIILGPDLRIRRFTPKTEESLNLIVSDIGRPITDMNLSIHAPELEKWISDVIENARSREAEVQDNRGNWHRLNIWPYRTIDNRIDGAILVLSDIDTLKRSQADLKVTSDFAQAIVETLREPLVILDEKLQVQQANKSFYEIFNLDKKVTGKTVYEILGHQLDVPSLHRLLHDVLSKNSVLKDFRFKFHPAKDGHKDLVLNARALLMEGSERKILLSMDLSPTPTDEK